MLIANMSLQGQRRGRLAMATRVLGVLALFIGASLPAQAAFGDCADPAYRAGFDPRLATVEYDCVERLRVDVATGDGPRRIRILHDRLADWIADERLLPEYDRGVRAAVAAMGRIGRFSLSDVSILLADDVPPGTTAERIGNIMAVANNTPSDECQITLYLIGDGATREEAATTIVHEIFHCVQAATFSPAQNAAYRRDGGSAWWIEGSAEWFASLALPDPSIYQARVDEFDAHSPDTPLHRMTYYAMVFFLWHAGRHGNPATMQFMSGMADSAAAGAQMQAMRDALPAEEWLRFAQDYLDRRIRRPHGPALRFNPQPGDTWRWANNLTERPRLQPFVLARNRIEVECGKWHTQVAPQRAHAARAQGGGDWGGLPDRIDTQAGDPVALRFVGFNSGSAPLNLQVTVRQESGCSDCAGITHTDRCLVGTWQQSGGGTVEWMQRNVPGLRIGQTDLQGQRLTLNADGSYAAGALSGTVSNLRMQGSEARSDARITSHASGRWSAQDGMLHLCPTAETVDGSIRITGRSGGSITQRIGPGMANGTGQMRYTCSDQLLQTELAIPRMPPVHTRYSPVR